MLHYLEAREKVVSAVSARGVRPTTEAVPLESSLDRVLAEEVVADRDYPPFDRSTRDGFAVRAADLVQVPVTLKCLGEVKAGEAYPGTVGAGDCLQIMTGAPVPAGADAVAMIEHTEPKAGQVVVKRRVETGANVVPRGSEARQGIPLLAAGTRIGYAEVSLLGQVGKARVQVYRRPRVAVLSTGDEVVPVEARPGPSQIRNSNSYSIAAQVALRGGEPVLLGNARDDLADLKRLVRRGLEEDLLVLSGGVSMGKYDLVEVVLRQLGAEFFFDAVAIRPGRPAVFGSCQSKFVFGLPGNPVSTMVTFTLFVAPAIALLGGAAPPPLQFFKARLAEPVKQTAQLTLFLPACLEGENADVAVRALPWQGSGDVVALARSNCFLVVPPNVTELAAGSWVDVLPRQL
ncbi:MAG: molybdopterin molybdotransferase MoeA [Acidobacteria bacterium]|nr:molybdopterin molybdotransferase MoeA [Acidobacteriota bacterium]